MDKNHAIVEQDGHVLIITLNRPEKRNALSPGMLVTVYEAWRQLDEDDNLRIINGNVLSGKKVNSDGYLGFYNNNISILREGNNYKLFGWIPFINNAVPSIYKSSFSWLASSKPKDYDTNLNGEERAFVVSAQYEKVLPFDSYPVQLFKSIITNDIEKMESLGIYEVSPEDFALCEFVCTSKVNLQKIVRDGLDLIYKECM